MVAWLRQAQPAVILQRWPDNQRIFPCLTVPVLASSLANFETQAVRSGDLMNKWLNEVSKSLEEAMEKSSSGKIPLQNLYQLAPLLYAQKNNMHNEALFKEMVEEIEGRVAEDYSHDEASRERYKFHYVSSYLLCYVVAGKLDEMEYDRIMDYVCSKMDLFDEE